MAPKKRLTVEQIIELRQRRAAGESLESLAEAFGIIPEYVSYVATGKIHKNVGGPIAKPFKFSAMAQRKAEQQH